jgi:hypothetical protein
MERNLTAQPQLTVENKTISVIADKCNIVGTEADFFFKDIL